MRVVLLGKGGSGKSTLGGLLCAALSDRGEPVVAMDADSVPGLGQVLGVEQSDDWFLAGMAERQHGGWKLTHSPAETVDRCARPGPGTVRFLQLGNADTATKAFEYSRQSFPDRWSGTVAFSTVARTYDDERGWVVVDLHGGTLQVAAGLAGTSGVAVAVVEPFAKSVLTARRFAEMGEWPPGVRLTAVANKVSNEDDEAWLRQELATLGIPVLAAVPDDPAVRWAEREGRALFTLDAATPARRAVAGLADRLAEAVPVPAP